MKLLGSNSLRTRLTWLIVVMQALVLIAFTAIAAVPIYRFLSEELRYDSDCWFPRRTEPVRRIISIEN